MRCSRVDVRESTDIEKAKFAISIGRLDRCVMTRKREDERLYCGPDMNVVDSLA